jgi:hypothetical protein
MYAYSSYTPVHFDCLGWGDESGTTVDATREPRDGASPSAANPSDRMSRVEREHTYVCEEGR